MKNKIRATVTFLYKGATYKKTATRKEGDVLYTTRMWLLPYTIPASDVIDVTEWI